jgi:long-chain fatty acid transport protein
MSTASSAAGFYLHEHSANGLGRAFAGQAAMAENATVLYSNPAAISAFKHRELSIFASHVDPGIDVTGEVTLNSASGSINVDASQSDISDSEVIPAAFYVQPINETWTVGLGLLANFGLSSDFDEDYNALHFGDRAEITVLNINPSLAYRYSEHLSIGVGVSFSHAEAELGTSVPTLVSNAINNLVPAQAKIAQMEGDDWGYGWNIGVFWQPSQSTNIGLSYRSKVNFELEGDLSSDIVAQYNQTGILNLDLPAMAELAIDQRITDNWSVQSSINWFGWSSFDVLEAELADNSTLLIGEEGFENNWKYSLGTTFELSPDWTLRGGYAYDQGAATDEHRSLNIPDTDRQWYSIGASYQFSDSSSIDLAWLKVKGKEASLSEYTSVGPLSSSLSASQKSSANIFSAQINFRF